MEKIIKIFLSLFLKNVCMHMKMIIKNVESVNKVNPCRFALEVYISSIFQYLWELFYIFFNISQTVE